MKFGLTALAPMMIAAITLCSGERTPIGEIVPAQEAIRQSAVESAMAMSVNGGALEPNPQVVGHDEGGVSLLIKRIGDRHFSVSLREPQGNGTGVLLRVEGASGRTVRIDFAGSPFTWFRRFHPLIAEVESLSDPKSFARAARPEGVPSSQPSAKVSMPDTSDQLWRLADDSWSTRTGVTCEHKFSSNLAYVSLRVPFLPDLAGKYAALASRRPDVEVLTIGQSREGRPLRIFKISSPEPDSEHKRPCVLMYAREHADEQDASWVVQGALDFVTSEDSAASNLRRQFTFLFIPLLDPDGAVAGRYKGITDDFAGSAVSAEALAYADWFRQWVDDGRRLDLVLNVHQPYPSTKSNIFCPMMDPPGIRGKVAMALHRKFHAALTSDGYSVQLKPALRGELPGRLGWFLSKYYGPLHCYYEVGSLSQTQQLKLAHLEAIGRTMLLSATTLIGSDSFAPLATEIERVRFERRNRWGKYGGTIALDDAVRAERECAWRAEHQGG